MSKSLPRDIPCFKCPARQSSLCSAFDDNHIAVLFANATQVKLPVDAYLYDEGDPNPFIYNVTHGLLMLERLASDGRRQVMAFVYPGDFIGLAPEGQYTVSAKCLKPAQLCRFPMAALEAMFAQYPDFERRIRKIGNLILNHALDQVFVLGRKNAAERLSSFFLHLAKRQNVRSSGGNIIELPMTRVDVADYLGLTVETVSRTFARLKADGLIIMPTLNRVEIPDFARLERASETYGPKAPA